MVGQVVLVFSLHEDPLRGVGIGRILCSFIWSGHGF